MGALENLYNILIVSALLGLWPAWIAKKKGRSFAQWWLFSTFISFLIAMPCALCAKDLRKKCPHCREAVDGEATACPHCTRQLQGVAA
jgi:hypothetical protein